ncbi:MAG TPA: tetratricopeptide repeat protein [Chloroflexota bacterium]|nr:tetratricopeptide repeat protein [Chloroflexota bacterium]
MVRDAPAQAGVGPQAHDLTAVSGGPPPDAHHGAHPGPGRPLHGPDSDGGPGAGGTRPPGQRLPAPLTSFVGREQEVAAVQRLLETSRLVTLTGPPGVGKTRLALETGAVAGGRHAHGVVFIPLAPLSRPDLVAGAIAAGLEVRESSGVSLHQALRQALRDRDLLLVLDNFEHLLPAAGLVAELLAGAPGLRVLATSRALLRVYGEQAFPVPPLPVPPPRTPSRVARSPRAGAPLDPLPVQGDVDALAQYETVRLFLERARAVASAFALTAANARAVAELCRRLDGLPLAIELAAARVSLLPPVAMLSHLERRLAFLTGGARDLPARQQTLREAIAWSYDLLEPEEQALFRRLAVFAGGFTLEAAEAVATESPAAVGGAPDPILDRLGSLLEKSLLKQEELTGEPRFTMLEVIHEFALERLTDHGELDATRRRHAAHFAGLAEAAEPGLGGPQQAVWLERLEREHQNLRAAMLWSAEQGEAELGLRLGGALWRFWVVRGHLVEGQSSLETLLERAVPAPAALRAKALSGAGAVARARRDHAAARAYDEAALVLWREIGDRAGEATALSNLGSVANELGEYDTARECYEQSLALRRSLGEKAGIARVLVNLGTLAYSRRDLPQAQSLYQESLRLRREVGDHGGIAESLSLLGGVARASGAPAAARARCAESLTLFRQLGHQWGTAISLRVLGEAAHDEGRDEEAATLLEESLVLLRERGDRENLPLVHFRLAEVMSALGAVERAAAHCREGLMLASRLKHMRQRASGLETAASLCFTLGLAERAARLWGAAGALRQGAGVAPLPADRAQMARATAAARVVLGEPRYTAAFQEGRGLSPEAAVEEALGWLQGPLPRPTAGPVAPSAPPAPAGLSAREVEVLRLVAAGKSNREIAAELVVSVRTVEHHVASIYGKLGVRGRLEASTYAMRQGLVAAPDEPR